MEALAATAAKAIASGFSAFEDEFEAITRRARTRFITCDWAGGQADAIDRLELYKNIVDRCVRLVEAVLGDQLRDRALWEAMKADYSPRIASRQDFELAETFFNSITRRIFATVGVNPRIEFVDSDFDLPEPGSPTPLYTTYIPNDGDLSAVIHRILADHPFDAGQHDPDTADSGSSHTGLSNAGPAGAVPAALPSQLGHLPGYVDAGGDAELAAAAIQDQIDTSEKRQIVRVEVLTPEFYRSQGAYLIGRVIFTPHQHDTAVVVLGAAPEPAIEHQSVIAPLVICLHNDGAGAYIDAVLLDEDEVSIVFSFARSYFHVETRRPHALVAFLKTIMPLKRIAELYIAIGYNKHGKTELYRQLLKHLATVDAKFEIARGERGMVMTVFTLPSFDMVFKIIKDHVDPPKTTSRKEVMERYDLVFKHDRAGRLVDAQEFEHLTFDRRLFSEALLAELQRAAPSAVTVHDDSISVSHLYIERRTTPLNLYVHEADPISAEDAIIDYGQAIKDLAATNIFPGDILLKNFGVTRHCRVVFYDYDELCHVTECNFRKVPPSRSFDDDFESDPWFYVGPMDIFPHEFSTFLGLKEPLRSVFIEHHAELFEVDFWRAVQKRHRLGEVVDIAAYPAWRKLRPAPPAGLG